VTLHNMETVLVLPFFYNHKTNPDPYQNPKTK
jgi:hypothetical protein